MNIEAGMYSQTKFLKSLGENKDSFKKRKEEFLEYFNLYFDYDYIPKKNGGTFILKEDFDIDEYTKFFDKRKDDMIKDYKTTLAQELEKFPYNTAANIARVHKDHNTREWSHKVNTSARYYGGIINTDYNKHWRDLKWVHQQTDKPYEFLTKEQQELWNECLREFNKSKWANRREQVSLLYLNGHLNWEETGNIIKEEEMLLYFEASSKFAKEYGFVPKVLPKIDKEPLNEEEQKIERQKKDTRKRQLLERKLDALMKD